MKIAFWGEDPQSGTTSGMLAVAGMVSVMQPELSVAVYNAAVAKKAEQHRIQRCDLEHIVRKDKKHIEFVDCGSGMDKVRCRMLRQADFVVVSLRQEEKCMQQFFMEESFLLPRRIVLLNNYSSYSRFTPEYAQYTYRADAEEFAVLSCNNEFAWACSNGKIRTFVKQKSEMPGSETNRKFLRELEVFSRLLLKNMEIVR